MTRLIAIDKNAALKAMRLDHLGIGQADDRWESAKSHDDRYTVAWGISHSDHDEGLFCCAVLFNAGLESARAYCHYIHGGAVSNSGTAALSIQNQDGPVGASAIVVIANDGSVLVNLHLSTEASGMDFDGSGEFLAFYTLGGSLEAYEDGTAEAIWFISAKDGHVAWRCRYSDFLPDSIRVNDAQRTVEVRSGPDWFRYSFDGEFLDAEALNERRFAQLACEPYGYGIYEAGLDLIGDVETGRATGPDPKKGEQCLRRALEIGMSPNTEAKALRLLGELAEARGDLPAALIEYREALSLDPKVGLRKRVAQLEVSFCKLPNADTCALPDAPIGFGTSRQP